MIEIQKLIYFIAIIDANYSLSLASKKLNISQPTLSLTIDTLEDYYQVQLLEKEKNKFIRRTPAGNLLYKDAKFIVEKLNESYLKISNPKTLIGELAIAIPPITQPIVTPKLIVQFKKMYPNIKLNICEKGAHIAKTKLLNSDLDFAFLTIFEQNEQIQNHQIYESDLVVIFNKNHPLKNKKTICAQDIAKYDFIGLDENFSLYKMIDIFFQNNNITIKYFHTSSRWDYLIEMISANDDNFITILPKPIVEIFKNKNVISRPFSTTFTWKVALSYKKERLLKKEAQIFIDFVNNFLKKG